MSQLAIKVKGQAVSGGADYTLVSVEEVANEMHQRLISAGKSPSFMLPFITQEFVDKYGFTAKYHSGTFLGYYLINEEGDDYYRDIFLKLKKSKIK